MTAFATVLGFIVMGLFGLLVLLAVAAFVVARLCGLHVLCQPDVPEWCPCDCGVSPAFYRRYGAVRQASQPQYESAD